MADGKIQWVMSRQIPLELRRMAKNPAAVVEMYLDDLLKELPGADIFQIRIGRVEHEGLFKDGDDG